MGIDNLGTLLRDKCPSAFIQHPITSFTGKRIAIDANNWMFKFMAISHRKVIDTTDVTTTEPDRAMVLKLWMTASFDSVCTWLAYGVTPVFVFDGEHPVYKKKTQQERRDKKEKARLQSVQLREEVSKMDILSRPLDAIEKLRKLLRQMTYISSSEIAFFRSLLVGVGIPVMQAKGEAEQLCSMLCIEGKVEAVFSADTDNLVYGCPLMLTEFTKPLRNADGTHIPQLSGISLSHILNGIHLSHSTFGDLCIMLGCDYNTNIPQIGGTRALSLIQKFGSIEQIPRQASDPSLIDSEICGCRLPKIHKGKLLTYSMTVLDHQVCREQFTIRHSSDCLSFGTLNINADNSLAERGHDVLSVANLTQFVPRLVDLYRAMPPLTQEELPRHPSHPRLVMVP